ncbi:MAG: InlB B-repeat-containing protein, partial [Erysipelothrix sp.]
MKKTISVVLSMTLLLTSFSNLRNINADEISTGDDSIGAQKINQEEISNPNLNDEIDKVTVKFETNGGSMDQDTFQVEIGTYFSELLSQITEPTKEGFVFRQWYTNPELTDPVYQDIRINEDTVLYALWEEMFDHTKLSVDLQNYLVDRKGYLLPISVDDIESIRELDLTYVYEDDTNGAKQYRTIRDFTGIEYFNNVEALGILIDLDNPVTNDVLQSLAKLPNIGVVKLSAKLPEEYLDQDYLAADWHIAKTISNKDNVTYYETEVLKYLKSLNYNTQLSGYDNKVSISLDYSLGFSDLSFLTGLNTLDESFHYELISGEVGTTFIEKFSSEIINGDNYYRIDFDNPFVFVYENAIGKLAPDSGYKFTTVSGSVDYRHGSYDDYTDEYYELLEAPLLIRYIDRDGNLIQGSTDDGFDIDFYQSFQVLLNEAQFLDLVRQYKDSNSDDMIMNYAGNVLRGTAYFSVDSELHDENGLIPDDNFDGYVNYQVIMDVSDAVLHHKVEFDTNGGNEIDPILNIENGTIIDAPSDPIKPGYTFGGWFLDNNEFNIDFDFSNPITRDITLYADWGEAAQTYTVTYVENGGTEVSDLTEVESGTKLNEPTTTKAGFIFKGWY